MEGIKIPIGAPLDQLNKDLTGANTAIKKSVSQLEIQLKSYQAVSKKALDPAIIASYNAKIQQTQAEISRLSNVGKVGFDTLGNAVEKSNNSIGRAYSGLTKLAYLIPGLGIAGLFNLGFKALSPLVSQLQLFNQELTKSDKAASTLGEAFASKEYGDAIKTFNELTINVDLAKRGLISKESVLKQYNESIGKTTGKVTTLDQAESALVKNGPAFIKMTLLKAAAQLALDEAAKKSLAAEKERQRVTGEGARGNDLVKQLEGVPLLTRLKVAFGQSNDALREYNKTQVKELSKGATDYLDIAKRFQEDAAKISSEINFDFLGNPEKIKASVGESKATLMQELEFLRNDLLIKYKGIWIDVSNQGIDAFKANFKVRSKEISTALGKTPLIPIQNVFGDKGAEYVSKELYTPFQVLKDEINFDLLPQMGDSFKTFFDDLLMHGKLSFKSLGDSIKNTFASVLASEATNGLLGLLGSKGSGAKGGGLFKAIGGLFGAGAGALGSSGAGATAAGTAATGGALVPILAGVAAVAGIASLFKKKQAPTPAQSNAVSTSSFSSASGFDSGTVVFQISGTNLIGVLNRAGAKLQRFGP